ncbi:MAG: tRNA epoxyqueuosine(34) reductase QueG [Flavobacteriales bacterium]|nr:tRNA epoxyqueuosine(34) reductase QueG [Flavobacteriales bacterium]
MASEYHRLKEKSAQIKHLAQKHGFDFCGISKAGFLEEEAPRLEAWLNQNKHGQMAYMANHFDKRLDPAKLVPGAKSVISLLLNYYSPLKQTDPEAPKISMYAYGEDYHTVIKNKMSDLLHDIRIQFGDVAARVFTDSAPVMEKAWAAKSGLGWVGKNANLIRKTSGSYFFISEIICDLDLLPDGPETDHCGSCTRCIDACPTEAITEPYKVDGSKCISYFTIELRDEIPTEMKGKFENWMFGCDICQEVCPWNRFSTPHNTPAFTPNVKLLETTRKEWQEITESVFEELFKKSPVKRTKFEGLRRNIRFITG